MFSLRSRTLGLLLFFCATRIVLAFAEPDADVNICDYGADVCDYDYGCLCPQCEGYLQCIVCGYEGSSPYRCIAYNATFDDLADNSAITAYQVQSYDGFLVADRDNTNPILPGSKKNYIRSTTGTGTLSFTNGFSDFGYNVGGLYYFDYACGHPGAKPNSSSAAVACYLTVTATCVQTDGDDYSTFNFNQTFTYQPYGKKVATMTSGYFSGTDAGYVSPNPFERDYSQICSGYSFSAVQFDGKPAFLYLDNVVVNGWYSPSDK